MYKDDKLVDRREMLRIKLKSLAIEAKYVRREERKTFGALQVELHQHRTGVIRRAARETHLAYGLICGKPLEQIEPGRTKFAEGVDAANIERMIKRYGPAQGVDISAYRA